MIVKHWMTTKVVSINKEASIQQALSIMKQASIRHLPVVAHDGQLIGWVTDADLRGVLIASMLEELTLEDVMIRKPVTASPTMSMDEAAQLIVERRIGGLPVIQDGKLVGIITVVDVLSAFITLMGLLPHTSRVDIEVADSGVALSEVIRIIENHQGKMVSICHLPAADDKSHVYSIRLKKCDLKPLVSALRKQGVRVSSSN